MSNKINNEKDDQVKNEPLLKEKPGEISKKTILMYYGLTVGAVILIVIIVLIIAVKLGGAPSEEKNYFISKYIRLY